VNTYEVRVTFWADLRRPTRTEWAGRVNAANKEHALLMAGIRIAHEHRVLVAESLAISVRRLKVL